MGRVSVLQSFSYCPCPYAVQTHLLLHSRQSRPYFSSHSPAYASKLVPYPPDSDGVFSLGVSLGQGSAAPGRWCEALRAYEAEAYPALLLAPTFEKARLASASRARPSTSIGSKGGARGGARGDGGASEDARGGAKGEAETQARRRKGGYKERRKGRRRRKRRAEGGGAARGGAREGARIVKTLATWRTTSERPLSLSQVPSHVFVLTPSHYLGLSRDCCCP